MIPAAVVGGVVTAGAGGVALLLAAVALDCARVWASGVPLSSAAALTGLAAAVAATGLAWLVL
ncbi:MAG TPA: hypothetical protein VFL46_07140, partial [Phycicoccus sp.]|nr:hypothetical protein [Phycicoccus sp.]